MLFLCADALFDKEAVTKVKEDDAIEYDNEGEIEKQLSELKGATLHRLILENIPINFQCHGYW